MLKKQVVITILLASGVAIIFLGVAIYKKINIKDEAKTKIQNLQSVQLFSLDSVTLKLPSQSNIVLIHFNSECSHCQKQLFELNKNASLFKNCKVVLMSTENIKSIKGIASTFMSESIDNFYFAKINSTTAFETFGVISIPHIFIYNKDRKLIKEFKGETEIKTILKSIP